MATKFIALVLMLLAPTFAGTVRGVQIMKHRQNNDDITTGCSDACIQDPYCSCNGGVCECYAAHSGGFEQQLYGRNMEENIQNNGEYVLVSTNMMTFLGILVALIVVWNIVLNISNCKMQQRLKENYQHEQV